MAGIEFAVEFDEGSRGAEVAGRAFAVAGAAEDLDFEGGWEILVDLHGIGRFAMDHDAAIAECPACATLDLLAGEAVFEAEPVVGVFFLVKQMAVAVVPLLVVRVIHLEHAMFDAVGILEIFAGLAAADFGGPTGEVLAIEDGFPFAVFGQSKGGGEGDESSDD